MAEIQGLAAHAAGAELLPFRYDPGELGPQEVEIAITHCGICHSDLHLISNDWGISQYPFIPGHEIVGTVCGGGRRGAVAQGGPAGGPGLAIELLRHVRVVHTGHGEPLRGGGGNLRAPHGGYADRVRANARFVIPIPEALQSEQRAAAVRRHYGV